MVLLILGVVFSNTGFNLKSVLYKSKETLDNLDEYTIYREPYFQVLSQNKLRIWTREELALISRYNIQRIDSEKLHKIIEIKD